MVRSKLHLKSTQLIPLLDLSEVEEDRFKYADAERVEHSASNANLNSAVTYPA